MFKVRCAFIFGLPLVFMLGCKESDDMGPVTFTKTTVERTSKEFFVPTQLSKEIEKKYLEFIRKENPKIVLPDDEIVSRIPRDFLDVEIFLQESAKGILSSNLQFIMPRGGGELDLKNYVVGSKGSFFLKFKAKRSSEENKEAAALRVYFLSQAKKRKIGSESYGADCNKYMDITDYVHKLNSEQGIQLNATDQRYLSVIGGTFYFVDFHPERKIYLSAVSVRDSRYPELMCDSTNQSATHAE